MTFVHIREILIVGAAVFALSGTAMADDHLFQAEQPGHGLFDNDHSQGIANSEEAPGQGSPFTGEETHTPSSLVVTGEEVNGTFPDAKPHANIKERTPK